ncbi:hypothetical protein Gotur_008493 [Gossypium turneri]
MKRLLRVIVLLMLKTLITKLLLKFWVLKGMVGFDFKDLLLTWIQLATIYAFKESGSS